MFEWMWEMSVIMWAPRGIGEMFHLHHVRDEGHFQFVFGEFLPSFGDFDVVQRTDGTDDDQRN